MTFMRYHADHHSYLNVPDVDPDMASYREIAVFNKWYKKLIFISLHPLFYAIRPMILRAKIPKSYELLN